MIKTFPVSTKGAREKKRSGRVLITALLGAMLFAPATQAAELPLFAGGMLVNVSVKSYKEQQFNNVIRQQRDFSCGSAAVATLLNFHYDRPVREEEVLDAMYAVGEKEKILREGFSLLDMKHYLAAQGLRAGGFRANLDKLRNVGIPAIALINTQGYLHFVVIKGITDTLVLVGDPSLGMRVMQRTDFEGMWNGILFIVQNDKEYAQSTFNRGEDWHTRASARFSFDAALTNQALSSFTVHTSPTPNYFF